MPGNWPVPFGKELSEKGPSHGHLVGGPLHSVKGPVATPAPRSVPTQQAPGTRGRTEGACLAPFRSPRGRGQQAQRRGRQAGARSGCGSELTRGHSDRRENPEAWIHDLGSIWRKLR
jgi:hypothetical protein